MEAARDRSNGVLEADAGDHPGSTLEQTPAVAVAIATYRRPQMLRIAIGLVLPQLAGRGTATRLIIVDNDPERSAQPVVAGLADARLHYVPEPRPGLAAVRNAALDAASDCRLLAFLDDDELPVDHWLSSLLDAWSTWRCDAVSGPTLRVLDESADPWVRASGFFAAPRRANGTLVEGAGAGNLLLDLDTVRSLGLRFDDRFGTTGGEDTLFTRQLSKSGGTIRWCDRAVASEPVPADRATRSWVLQRELRSGNTWSRVHLRLASSRSAWARTVLLLLAIALKLTIGGTLRGLLAGPLGDRVSSAVGARERARARGVLVGLLGARVEEYRRPVDAS